MFGIGMTELCIIAGILVILFGAKRLPSIGRDLGAGIREWRKAGKELLPDQDEDEREEV